MGTTIITLIMIGFVTVNVITSIFGIGHKNQIVDLLLAPLTCQKCFTFWLTLFYLIIIGPFSIPILFITTGSAMILEKIYNLYL